MKLFFILSFLLLLSFSSFAKSIDTVRVKPEDLDLKAMQPGNFTYILFNKPAKDGYAQRVTLVKLNVESTQYHDKPAFIIKQEWQRDTLLHNAYTVFDAKTFATVFHETFWKSSGLAAQFDFDTKQVTFNDKGRLPDSVKAQIVKDFNQSFDGYNLNWHADLLIYRMLPYKADRTFVINFYDPGLSKAENILFTVTGSEPLTGSNGEKIDCWVLNHQDPENPKGYERYWIAKKTKEVLKEEDFGGRGYRYKLKLGISGEK